MTKKYMEDQKNKEEKYMTNREMIREMYHDLKVALPELSKQKESLKWNWRITWLTISLLIGMAVGVIAKIF